MKRTGDPSEAEIRQAGQLVAYLDRDNDKPQSLLRLQDDSKRIYRLDPRVDGVISPFSSEISDDGGDILLKIKSGVFSYNGKIYVFKSLPEGKSMKGHLSGSKHIIRLENFPYHKVDDIDRETRERLYRHRGVDVGQLSGFGKLGHKVTIGDELRDIGLQLAAASYLMYSTG